jgi:SAM-dependent methyltransferase
MEEGLYTEHPELYDAIQSGWDYDRDVAFVLDALAHHGVSGERLLEVGCGTGEHTRRLVEADYEVTAVDPHDGMLSVARAKCGADFRRTGLPELGVEGTFDAAVAVRRVLNHLPPGELLPALRALGDRLADGGVLVFDNSPLPSEGNCPALDVGRTESGTYEYARVAHHVPTDGGRLEWHEVVFTPGDCFVSTREMTPFEDGVVATALADAGFDVRAHDGFGPGDDRTVFVAIA